MFQITLYFRKICTKHKKSFEQNGFISQFYLRTRLVHWLQIQNIGDDVYSSVYDINLFEKL